MNKAIFRKESRKVQCFNQGCGSGWASQPLLILSLPQTYKTFYTGTFCCHS